MKSGYIYCLTDRHNDKKYVGQHRAIDFDIKYYGSGRIIKDMAKKHNLGDRFKREILDWCEEEKDLDFKERLWVKELNTLYPNGYNLTNGGEQSKCYSEETKIKISKSVSGERHRLYGKHHSQEVVEKIREGNLGKKKIISIEGKEKQKLGREKALATFRSDNYRNKMRELVSGINNPRYKKINKDEFLNARKFMTIKQLVSEFNIGKSTIYNKLVEFGVIK